MPGNGSIGWAYRPNGRRSVTMRGPSRLWAPTALRVPAGHPHAGRPFVLADWQIAVLDDVLTHRETLLCIARKNAKSALIAVLALAHLCGPLRRAGWRCGVLSANRGKAGELLRQCEEIASSVGARRACRFAARRGRAG